MEIDTLDPGPGRVVLTIARSGMRSDPEHALATQANVSPQATLPLLKRQAERVGASSRQKSTG
jgi:hypothetical protein